jgi:hypothetical protein
MEVIERAVETLRSCNGGTDVLLLSKELYRKEPIPPATLGSLGVDTWVEGVRFFLTYSLAEDILVYGETVANEVVKALIKTKIEA